MGATALLALVVRVYISDLKEMKGNYPRHGTNDKQFIVLFRKRNASLGQALTRCCPSKHVFKKSYEHFTTHRTNFIDEKGSRVQCHQ